MPNENDALGIIQFLSIAYDKNMTADQLKAYARGLADVQPEALKRAADEWTRTQKWFPRISELLALCHNAPDSEGDQLIARLLEENDRALSGDFRPEQYLRLIIRLRNSDRESSADAWRRRYDILSGAITDERRHALAADWIVDGLYEKS